MVTTRSSRAGPSVMTRSEEKREPKIMARTGRGAVSQGSKTPAADNVTHQVKTPPVARVLDYNLPTPRTPSRKRPSLCITPAEKSESEMKADTPTPSDRPLTPSTPRIAHNVFTRAKQAFSRSATPSSLVGRVKEKEAIQAFLDTVTSSKATSSCLYISGNPGTGKTALVTRMVEDLTGTNDIRIVKLNCVEILTSTDIFAKLCDRLSIGSSASPQSALEGYFGSAGSFKTVVLLDEIDHLLAGSSNHTALYEVFAWPFKYPGKFCLIGIANALDLTHRFLPRLKVDNRCPQLMHFGAYTVSDIAAIIRNRLLQFKESEAGPGPSGEVQPSSSLPLFQLPALQLCAQKVASATGDLRKALDVCKSVIGLVEEETKLTFQSRAQLNQAVDADFGPSTPPDTPTKKRKVQSDDLLRPRSSHEVAQDELMQLTWDTAPKATPVHVVKVCKAMFSNKAIDALRTTTTATATNPVCDAANTQRRLGGLSLQPRLVLLSILLAREEGRCRGLETEGKNGTSCGMKRSLSNISNSSSSSNGSGSADTSFQAALLRYQRLLKDHDVANPVTKSEFDDLITVLESSGLVTQFKKSSSRMGPVTSNQSYINLGLGEDETIKGLENIAVVGDLLRFELAKVTKERARVLLSLEWERESKKLHLNQVQNFNLSTAQLDGMMGKREHLDLVDPEEMTEN